MESRWKKWAAAVALTVSAGLVMTGCAGGGGSGGGDGESSTLSIAVRQDLMSFDTGELDTGAQVQYWMAVYDTLLVVEPDGAISPNLATSYEYNDDNTVLTLELREDITFTDGEPFDAEAVKANIEHLKQGTGVNVYMVAAVSDVVVVDDHTVEIHLTEPDPAFTYYLGLVAGAMASPKAFGTPEFATTPIGSGPYTLDSAGTIRGSQYTFVRNEDYWNKDAYPFDRYVVKPMEDVTARLNAIKSGQVNSAEIDSSVRSEAESSSLDLHELLVGWQGFYLFDRDGVKEPALADLRVRQALAYAIDREAIVKNIYKGNAEVSVSTFVPLSPAYVPELNEMYEYNPEKARELLKEAGYESGLKFSMPELPEDLTRPVVQQQLADVGIEVVWDKIAREDAVAGLLAGDWSIASFGSSSGHPWRDLAKNVTGAWNPFHTMTPELEALLDTVRTTTGDEQDDAYKAINTYLVENAWFSAWYLVPAIQVTDAATDVEPQFGSGVPYLRNFTPAG